MELKANIVPGEQDHIVTLEIFVPEINTCNSPCDSESECTKEALKLNELFQREMLYDDDGVSGVPTAYYL